MGELIAHGVTGFLVDDIDSAVAAVAAAGELDRRKIAELAAERFTVATMIDKYVKVYRDVIGNRTVNAAARRCLVEVCCRLPDLSAQLRRLERRRVR